MKKLVLLATLATLSACSQKAEESKEPAAAPTETAAPAPAANPGTAPGSYDVKMADGTTASTASTASTVINADGTYVDTDAAGKTVKKGKFAHKDGKDCFDPDGDEAEACWALSPVAADGSFTATAPDGTAVTVTPKKS